MIEEMSQSAASAACSGIELAIKGLETRIGIKLDNIDVAAREYFSAQKRADTLALDQLKRLRAQLHKRAFDAYREETASAA